MSNKVINTLGYTGVVTISRYINSKKIKIAQVHNAGGKPLFNFLSDCLLGDYEVAKPQRPHKIMLLNHKQIPGESDVFEAASSGFISLLTRPEKIFNTSEGTITVRYSFMLSRDHLEGQDFNCLGLYGYAAEKGEPDSFAAYCDVDIPKGSISASAVLVVDWELTILNTSKGANT